MSPDPRRVPEPPETDRRPVTETMHGEEIVDPYRWLEDDTDEVQSWVDAQNEYADRVLDVPARDRLHPRFEDLARTTDYYPLRVRGGTYFQRVERPDADHPVLTVRERPDDERTVLVDPNEWGGPTSMGWYQPSLDGNLVAYGVTEGGDEQYDVRVVDLDGELVDELTDVGRSNSGTFAWTDDGFYYMTTGGVGGGDQLEKGIAFHELGGDPAEDRRIDVDLGQRQWPVMSSGEDGTLAVAVSEMSVRADLYVCSPGEDALRPVLTGEDATFFPAVRDGTVFVRTTHGAPNRRVLATPVERYAEGEMAVEEFDVAVPEDEEAILQSTALADDRLIVHRHRDAESELAVYDPETGEHVRDVALEPHSQVGILAGNEDAPEAFYRVQSFDRPPSVVRIDVDTGETTELDRSGGEVNVALTTTREWFESADGTEVPAFVVHREDLEPDGTSPAVVYGYGGFRNSMLPSFRRYAVPFLEACGVYVWSVLRGGAEFGEEWHEAGMRENKQNVFDDFYAVAEGVIEEGYADPDRVAARGGSNGGLLVGAAITQRPDLWTAGVAGVPLMDMLRFHRFLLGEAWANEYGSPEDPEAFEYLREYSPYHNVTERDYPATLLHTAAGDSRVHPAHARKMAARLQANQTADRPVLLRTDAETGHGVGTPTSLEIAQALDKWTFLFDQLGVEPARGPS